MIKVTKEPVKREIGMICPICGCEFTFEAKDASWDVEEEYLDNNREYGLRVTITGRIRCPRCATKLYCNQKK